MLRRQNLLDAIIKEGISKTFVENFYKHFRFEEGT
jgi:hypothetical protein